VMERGQVVVATADQIQSKGPKHDLGGCTWVPTNENRYGQELAAWDATSPRECIELVKKNFPNASIANLPYYGRRQCYAQYPE